jgi:hypothetical protein
MGNAGALLACIVVIIPSSRGWKHKAAECRCLVDTEDPHTALSGCVTWRMKVSLKRRGKQDIESGVFYRIESNVTPEDKRSGCLTYPTPFFWLTQSKSEASTANFSKVFTERLPCRPP